MLRPISLLALCCAVLSGALTFSLPAQQPKPQKLDTSDLDRAHAMLRQCYEEVKKSYYDPTFHGIDFDASYKQYDARLNQSASVNDTFRVIAAFLLNLKDSHTYFRPPMRMNRSTFGYTMEIIGEKSYITHVRPGTDAAAKLHAGDQVLAINGYKFKRADAWSVLYFFHTLSPSPSEQLSIQNPAGEQRQEIIKALIKPGKQILDASNKGDGSDYWQLVRADEADDYLDRERFIERGDTIIWKMPSFGVSEESIGWAFDKVRRHKTLLLDLRSNPGGSVDTLKTMLAYTFDHDVKVADVVSRKDTKPMLIKAKFNQPFTGKLIVVIDGNSASWSEVYARVIQIEKRGEVIGDVSRGAVMEFKHVSEFLGTDSGFFYGLSITEANLLMTDGKSLENVGVTPDELILPTATDIADGKDPVLAHAADLAGMALTPAEAGKLFPFEWARL